jgi:ceramide glucosyltransferase
MTTVIWATAAVCGFLTIMHLLSVATAIVRCRRGRHYVPASPDAPAVSLIRPVCGIENHGEETLRSTFTLDYPRYEIIFCVSRGDDPVVPLVRRLMAAHGHVPARLLVGEERINDNPKLNNVAKGWRAAVHDWIIIADSNVLMPPDYIQRMLARWLPRTGLVCSPPVGSAPVGLWAELECAFLNTFQVRWQYFADTIGLGFAQGKNMLWQRKVLENAGGIRALGAEPAEDAAATKIVRRAGLKVRLADEPFPQPLGYRSAADVWGRQLRWARLRRATFRHYYALEILVGGFWPLLGAVSVAAALEAPVISATLAFAMLWYGAEALLVLAAGWHLSWRSPLLWMLRDLLLPVLWVNGWIGTGFVWRGNYVQAVETGGTV